jgi:hypothetical protein
MPSSSGRQAKRDMRLHTLLKQAVGTKPMGLKTFSTPGLKLRRAPSKTEKRKQQQQQQQQKQPPKQVPLTRQALRQHTSERSDPFIPPLKLSHRQPSRSKRRQRLVASTPHLINSSRPSTVGSFWDNGPSTLRRRVEAGKRSEWAQIVQKDLENYRNETAYVKQLKKREALKYAQDIKNTINLRASSNNPDIAKAEKERWKKVLVQEENSNNIVRQAQIREEKLKALQLKKDRDIHVQILKKNRKEEKDYHEYWNQKIINDAKEEAMINVTTKKLKKKREREYLLKTMKEHSDAKKILERKKEKQLKIEQDLQNKHNQHVKGQYVTEAERRKRETERIDLIQTRLMKLGEKWVGKNENKREREQHHFATKMDGPQGQSRGLDYEIELAKYQKKVKKKQMRSRRRELLEQIVLKKERKMNEKIAEADFALSASAETIKAGMLQAYYDEDRLRRKDQYARELKEQIKRRVKIKRKNPTGIHARMTENERTLNSKTLKQLGITGSSHNSSGIRRKGGVGSFASGRGPESQIFLNSYDEESLVNVSSQPKSNSIPVSQAPFHVDTITEEQAAASLTRSQTPFNEYRRNRDTAHEELMKLKRPGTSGSSLYSSLRHSHNPRRSRSWFDDEL